MFRRLLFAGLVFTASEVLRPLAAAEADLIVQHAKVATVDAKFSFAQALAVRGDKILAVGSDAEIAKLAGPRTRARPARGAGLDGLAHASERRELV